MLENLWHNMPAGDQIPDIVNVVVEIPKGSQNKYEYDKTHNVIRLDRVLYSSLHYPEDYGIVPRTLSEDQDPLDVLVLMRYSTYPGILLQARPIALLKMKDAKKIDNKILCVAVHDPRYARYKDITDVDEHVLKEITHFFQAYKELEGKKVVIEGWGSAKEAKKIIMDAVRSYAKNFRKYPTKEGSR
jgi:inorganic pyrophosphatase